MDADVTSKLYLPQLSSAEPGRRRLSAALLSLSGPLMGEIFPLSASPILIGRGVESDLRLIAEGISRRHAQLVRVRERWVLEDVGSRNGTLVNGRRVKRAVLSPGDQILLGLSTILKYVRQDEVEAEFRMRLQESALCDPLTRVFNRRYFQSRLRGELAYAARHRCPLSLLLLDVDHFKKLNDEEGHLFGDQALVAIADAIRTAMRGEDVLARYGGEEFALLIRGIALVGAQACAERIRRTISEMTLLPKAPLGPTKKEPSPVRVTVSIGVAQLQEGLLGSDQEGMDTVAEWLIGQADAALYAAKDAGRNCVRVSAPLSGWNLSLPANDP